MNYSTSLCNSGTKQRQILLHHVNYEVIRGVNLIVVGVASCLRLELSVSIWSFTVQSNCRRSKQFSKNFYPYKFLFEYKKRFVDLTGYELITFLKVLCIQFHSINYLHITSVVWFHTIYLKVIHYPFFFFFTSY